MLMWLSRFLVSAFSLLSLLKLCFFCIPNSEICLEESTNSSKLFTAENHMQPQQIYIEKIIHTHFSLSVNISVTFFTSVKIDNLLDIQNI